MVRRCQNGTRPGHDDPWRLVARTGRLPARRRLHGRAKRRSARGRLGLVTRMIDSQLRARGIADKRVLDAMQKVPRHLFVPEPLACVRQPACRLATTDDLAALHRGLHERGPRAATDGSSARNRDEVGLRRRSSELAGDVPTRSRSCPSWPNARARDAAGYRNVRAPRQRISRLAGSRTVRSIIVTAAPEKIPQALVDQLAVGGIMVIPVGAVYDDQVRRSFQTDKGVVTRETLPVRFVPMKKRIE